MTDSPNVEKEAGDGPSVGELFMTRSVDEYTVKLCPASGSEVISASVRRGDFVKISSGGHSWICVSLGVEHSMREELIPYISPEKHAKYLPFQEDYRTSCLRLLAVGVVRQGGAREFSVKSPPELFSGVELMSREEVADFHAVDGGGFKMPYLNGMLDRVGKPAVLDMLEIAGAEFFPESEEILLAKRFISRRDG